MSITQYVLDGDQIKKFSICSDIWHRLLSGSKKKNIYWDS